MEKIGIVLVNYNGFEDTVECIESINKIKDTEYEIIVVDNASTDSSYEKLKNANLINCTVIEAEQNLGFSAGNNIGIQHAKETGCNYILLLNNDTYVDKEFLRYFLECVHKYDDKAVIAGKILYADAPSKIWYAGGKINWLTGRTVHYGIHEPDDGKYDDEKIVTFISGCCMFLPIKIIDIVGLMDEDYFLYCEDTDYCLRILKAGYRIMYEPKSKIYHKINASTNKIAGIQTYYLVRNKLYIIKKHIKPIFKPLSYVYIFLETIKRTLCGEYEKKSVVYGIRDFKRNIIGERPRS